MRFRKTLVESISWRGGGGGNNSIAILLEIRSRHGTKFYEDNYALFVNLLRMFFFIKIDTI